MNSTNHFTKEIRQFLEEILKFFQNEIILQKSHDSTINATFNGSTVHDNPDVLVELTQINEQPNNQYPFVRIEENNSNSLAKTFGDFHTLGNYQGKSQKSTGYSIYCISTNCLNNRQSFYSIPEGFY